MSQAACSRSRCDEVASVVEGKHLFVVLSFAACLSLRTDKRALTHCATPDGSKRIRLRFISRRFSFSSFHFGRRAGLFPL